MGVKGLHLDNPLPTDEYVMTRQEVADALGLAPRSIKDIERRALRKLAASKLRHWLNNEKNLR